MYCFEIVGYNLKNIDLGILNKVGFFFPKVKLSSNLCLFTVIGKMSPKTGLVQYLQNEVTIFSEIGSLSISK
jgi:hypothetical protein